jgi:hypothetical protein
MVLTLQLFEQLAKSDIEGNLNDVRPAVEGK